MSRPAALAAVAVTVLVVGGTFGYAQWQQSRAPADAFADCRNGQTGGADIGGPFTLLDPAGATVTEADVLKGPTLVYFGYTFCPDVCPLDMARNAEAMDILEEQGKLVDLVFITVDPARDTPQVAGGFADAHHPRALGLSGSEAQVKAAADAYRAYFKKQDSDDPELYGMDHSTFTYLMLPGSGFADFYRRELPADQLAQSVGCFLDRSPA